MIKQLLMILDKLKNLFSDLINMLNLFKKRNLKNKVERRLNVIMITLDGLRVDFVDKLPNLRKLILSSTYFNNLTTYAPYSTGAFHAIFSGIYGSENGVNSYYSFLDFKKDKCKVITQYFKERDYVTIGDSMSIMVLPKQGFDKYLEQKEGMNIKKRYDELIEELNNLNKKNKNFFIHFHIRCIHDGLIHNVAKKYKFDDKIYYNQILKNKQNYLGYAQEADSQLGFIIEKLEKYDLLENSILIVLSDHGASCGEKFGERYYGALCYDITLRTFAIFHNNLFFPVRNMNQLGRTVDIMPTILEVLNIKEDSNFVKLTGKSLFSIIKNQEQESRIAFSETAPLEGNAFYTSPKEPIIYSIKYRNWKLIFIKPLKKFELYNVDEDPQENKDLFGKGFKEEQILIKIMKKYKDL